VGADFGGDGDEVSMTLSASRRCVGHRAAARPSAPESQQLTLC